MSVIEKKQPKAASHNTYAYNGYHPEAVSIAGRVMNRSF